MLKRVLLVMLLCLLVAVVHAEGFLGDITPDAGLYAQTIDADSSRGVEGLSWEITTLDKLPLLEWAGPRRLWGDLLKPFDRLGVAGSVDIKPRSAACFGGGYQPDYDWILYVGVHID